MTLILRNHGKQAVALKVERIPTHCGSLSRANGASIGLALAPLSPRFFPFAYHISVYIRYFQLSGVIPYTCRKVLEMGLKRMELCRIMAGRCVPVGQSVSCFTCLQTAVN